MLISQDYLKYITHFIFQVLKIIEHIRSSMTKMVCFKPEDTIFLLNKWDTLLEDDDPPTFLKETKERLHSIWEEINDNNILPISAGRVRIIKTNACCSQKQL